MAIQRDVDYPGRWGTATADYPGGVPQNRTTPTSADGSYLEEKLWKDTFGGIVDAAIAQGDITRSGVPDTAQASDVIDGLKAIMATQSLEWSALRNYNHPVIVSGSDDQLYLSVQDNGPATTVQDPTTDASDTYWILLADVIGGGSVEAWSSGTDYTNPVQVYGSDDRLYISQQDSGPSGVGAQNPTTDDGTYWRVLDNSFGYEFLHIQKQTASGVAGASISSGQTTRELNTVIQNTISGASLSSNLITLPPGDFYSEAVCTMSGNTLSSRIFIYNSTDATFLADGISCSGSGDNRFNTFVRGRFSLSATKDITIRQYNTNIATEGVETSGIGQPEVWADLRIWKVK